MMLFCNTFLVPLILTESTYTRDVFQHNDGGTLRLALLRFLTTACPSIFLWSPLAACTLFARLWTRVLTCIPLVRAQTTGSGTPTCL
jgi:hypothetical protein